MFQKFLGVVLIVAVIWAGLPSSVALSSSNQTSFYDSNEPPHNRLNTVFPSLFSLVLPGFGQWIRGQVAPAAVYTGVAAAGLTYASRYTLDITQFETETYPTLSDEKCHFLKLLC